MAPRLHGRLALGPRSLGRLALGCLVAFVLPGATGEVLPDADLRALETALNHADPGSLVDGMGDRRPPMRQLHFQFQLPTGGGRRGPAGPSGFDPFAMMLNNMRPIAEQHALQVSGGRQLGGAPALGMPMMQMMPLPMQVGQIMKMLGDGTGALGESSHFQIEDNEGGMRITAQLPGHKLGSDGRHPLQVRIAGRTLIVQGTHLNPPIMTEFQRSFHLPRRVALSRITVDYSTTSGKLLITLPPRLVTPGEAEEESPLADKQGDDESQSPFEDMEENMRRFFEDSSRLPSAAPQGSFRSKKQVLRRPTEEEVLGLFDTLVARNHQREDSRQVDALAFDKFDSRQVDALAFGKADVYVLESVAAPDKYLNVGGGLTDDGAVVMLWPNAEARETQWHIVERSAGVFNIQNANAPEKYMSVIPSDDDEAHELDVILWGAPETPDSQWRLSPTRKGALNGTFMLESVGAEGKFLSFTQFDANSVGGSVRAVDQETFFKLQAGTSHWRIFRLGQHQEDNTTYLGCFGESQLPAARTRVPEAGAYVEMKARAEGGSSTRAQVDVEFFNLASEPMEVWLENGEGNRSLLETIAGAGDIRSPGPEAAKGIKARGGDALLWVRPSNESAKAKAMQRVPIFPGRLLSVYTGNASSEPDVDVGSELGRGRHSHFAIARSLGHQLQKGHEWTLSGRGAGYVFSEALEATPKFGTAECGTRCLDGEHWCGCDPAASDVEILSCPGGERRFAAYVLSDRNGSRAVAAHERAVWHLGKDEDGTPLLEVHAPPGQELRQESGRLFVVPASADTPGEAAAAAGGSAAQGISSEPITGEGLPPAPASGNVGVPLDLSEEDCDVSPDKSAMRCRLQEKGVKELPVRYTNDEL